MPPNRVHHHLRASAVRQLGHRVDRRFARYVYRIVDAESNPRRATVSVGFDGDDARCAQPSQVEVVEQPRAPLPNHDDGLAGHGRQFASGEDDGAQLLRHHQLRDRAVVREFDDEMRRNRLVGSEVARLPYVRHRQDARSLAQARGAGILHDADSLVAGLAGSHGVLVPWPAVVDVVQVRATDGGHLHLHQHLVGPRLQLRNLVADDISQTPQDRRLHRSHQATSPSTSTVPSDLTGARRPGMLAVNHPAICRLRACTASLVRFAML